MARLPLNAVAKLADDTKNYLPKKTPEVGPPAITNLDDLVPPGGHTVENHHVVHKETGSLPDDSAIRVHNLTEVLPVD